MRTHRIKARERVEELPLYEFNEGGQLIEYMVVPKMALDGMYGFFMVYIKG